MADREQDDYIVDLGNGESITLRWDSERIAYVGVCPQCGGRVELVGYDDGDNMWDDCLECDDCEWEYWLV